MLACCWAIPNVLVFVPKAGGADVAADELLKGNPKAIFKRGKKIISLVICDAMH